MDNNYQSRVAAQVRQAWTHSGFSLNGLATATGIPRNTLRRRLDGHVAFDVDQVARIGTALNVPVESLLA